MGLRDDAGELKGLTISVCWEEQDVVVRPVGELDISTASQLRQGLADVATLGSRRMILDLHQLRFSDAAGLRSIVETRQTLGARLVVRRLRPQVQRLLAAARVGHLLGLEDEALAIPPRGARNVEYVRRLWSAFAAGGVRQFARLVPSDVEWRPLRARGHAFRDTQALVEFFESIAVRLTSNVTFSALGDDVLVSGKFTDDGTQFWWLYRFDGERLRQGIGFERRTEALAAHRLSCAA